tara:strand:- start:292 stop:567 length:276 start_codon:yes stop_codon:yes gene_type:complete
MKLISEIKDLTSETLPGSHITIHLAAQYLGIDENLIDKREFYHDYAKDNPQSKVRFGISAFPGSKIKLSKEKQTPQRYDGEWIVNMLKIIY